MTVNEIWTSIYDKGFQNGPDSLSKDLIDLWYFIDFTIYVDNGGPTGFLYNKSPSRVGDNEYLPYIKSWRNFQYHDLADLVERYNELYSKVIEAHNSNDQKDFDNFADKFGLNSLADIISPKINEANYKNNKVWDWIEKNQDTLTKHLQD